MCIALISNAHPRYPFILLSNRDEFLNRPTQVADWWESPHSNVLGGRDLQSPAHGTWLGITKQGRIAVLTNFREEGQEIANNARSRGSIPSAYLGVAPDSKETPEEFAKRLVEDEGVQGVGGFSLAFGQLRKPRNGKTSPIGIISNRTPDVKGVQWIASQPESTFGGSCGLSNSFFGDREWPKVVNGEKLLSEIIQKDVDATSSQRDLINKFMDLLSTDTLPKKPAGQSWAIYSHQLRNSILIPPVGSDQWQAIKGADELAAAQDNEEQKAFEGVYGTQKQTVVLVDQDGHAKFVERTLFDHNAQAVDSSSGYREFDFEIEGWND